MRAISRPYSIFLSKYSSLRVWSLVLASSILSESSRLSSVHSLLDYSNWFSFLYFSLSSRSLRYCRAICSFYRVFNWRVWVSILVRKPFLSTMKALSCCSRVELLALWAESSDSLVSLMYFSRVSICCYFNASSCSYCWIMFWKVLSYSLRSSLRVSISSSYYYSYSFYLW